MNCPSKFGKSWKIHIACPFLDPHAIVVINSVLATIQGWLDFYIKNVYNLGGYKIWILYMKR